MVEGEGVRGSGKGVTSKLSLSLVDFQLLITNDAVDIFLSLKCPSVTDMKQLPLFKFLWIQFFSIAAYGSVLDVNKYTDIE